jgi:hypothetical protein
MNYDNTNNLQPKQNINPAREADFGRVYIAMARLLDDTVVIGPVCQREQGEDTCLLSDFDTQQSS